MPHHWAISPAPILLFNLETRSHRAAQAELELCRPRKVSNLRFPCLSLMSSWDNRHVPPEPTRALLFPVLNLLKLMWRMLTYFLSLSNTYAVEDIEIFKAVFHRLWCHSFHCHKLPVSGMSSCDPRSLTFLFAESLTYVCACASLCTPHVWRGLQRLKGALKITGTGVTGLQ